MTLSFVCPAHLLHIIAFYLCIMIKLLLTSSGIANPGIHKALTDLLGKAISECDALFIPTGIYPFEGGAFYAGQSLYGSSAPKLAQLGWKSLGVLELTALPGIEKDIWAASVHKADAILVWGGDPLYIAYWLQASGLMELLAELERDIVYVGVSAGAMAACSIICEAYSNPPAGRFKHYNMLTSAEIMIQTPDGEINRTVITARGAGMADFAIIPHYENPNHPDAVGENAALWAAHVALPVYAIDDQTAIKLVDGKVDIISEGSWKLFNAASI
jgi:dipeptidase E